MNSVFMLNTRLVNKSRSVKEVKIQKQQQPQRNIFRIIEQGYVGYKTTLGKNPKMMEPGIRLLIPFIQNFRRIDMREICLPIKDLKAFTKDNVPVVVSGSLFFQVRDAYKCCFEVQDSFAAVVNVGESSFRSVCGTLNYDDIIADRKEINHKLCDVVGKSTDQWGVETTKFEIQKFEPQNKEVQRQLELQMEAERRRRQQELDTLAKINVAEGEKKAAILKSQGEMETVKNNTEALVDQLNQVGGEVGSISEAMKFLLELRKYDAVKDIAKGPNNTFFLPDSKSLLAIAPQNFTKDSIVSEDKKDSVSNIITHGTIEKPFEKLFQKR